MLLRFQSYFVSVNTIKFNIHHSPRGRNTDDKMAATRRLAGLGTTNSSPCTPPNGHLLPYTHIDHYWHWHETRHKISMFTTPEAAGNQDNAPLLSSRVLRRCLVTRDLWQRRPGVRSWVTVRGSRLRTLYENLNEPVELESCYSDWCSKSHYTIIVKYLYNVIRNVVQGFQHSWSTLSMINEYKAAQE